MDDIIGIINRIEKFSSKHTFKHETNVGNLVLKLSIKLGLPALFCEMVCSGGQIHDIGKTAIPESILLKTGKLDADELLIMQQHSKLGYDIIQPYLHDDEESIIASNIILHHHEAYDGTGYPIGLKGEDIPIEARIATICDIYDALREARPYRAALSHKETIDLMCEPNTHKKIDPEIFTAFLSLDHAEILT